MVGEASKTVLLAHSGGYAAVLSNRIKPQLHGQIFSLGDIELPTQLRMQKEPGLDARAQDGGADSRYKRRFPTLYRLLTNLQSTGLSGVDIIHSNSKINDSIKMT